MCNPAAIALMAASTAVDYKNQSDATDRMNKEIGLSENRNDKFSQSIINASDKNLEQYNPDTRIENLQTNQDKSEKSLTDALTTARDNQASNSVAAQGKVSDTYTNSKAERAIKRAKAGADLAKMISKVRAPTTLRNDEQQENAKASTVMGTQAQQRSDMARASGYDIENASKLNPSMQLISGLLRGASMAYGGAGGAAGTAGKTAVSSSSFGGAIG